MLAGAGAIAAAGTLSSYTSYKKKLKGTVKHSVCRWCFSDVPLEDLCAAASEIGLVGIDLVGPDSWPTLKKHGLISTMCNGAEINIPKG